jgi:hypothetical protein
MIKIIIQFKKAILDDAFAHIKNYEIPQLLVIS